MYSAYSAAALSLRAKPSFHCSSLPLSSSDDDHHYYHYDELDLALARNPNLLLLLNSHLLRPRPTRIHWTLSRTFLPSPSPAWRWQRRRCCVARNPSAEIRPHICCCCEGFSLGRPRLELDEKTRVLRGREETCSSESDEGLWRRRGGFRVLDRKGRDGYDCCEEGDRVRQRERRDRNSNDGERVSRRKGTKVGCSKKCRREDTEDDDEYEERDLVGKRCSEKGLKNSKRNSSSRGEGSASRATRYGDVDGRHIKRGQWRLEDSDERFCLSVDSDREEREAYADEEERFIRSDSREGLSRKVKRASEVGGDYRTRVSSSNFRGEDDATRRMDRIDERVQRVQRRDEVERSSQNLKEIREVYDGDVEAVKRDKRSQINQKAIDETENEVVATRVDHKVSFASSSKKNSELKESSQTLRDIATLRNSNLERESHSKRHFEVSSISARRDTQDQTNRKVVSVEDLGRQNPARTNVSRVNRSDAEVASNSQRILRSQADNCEHSTKVANIVHEEIEKAEQNNQQVFDLARTGTDVKAQKAHNARIENEHGKRWNSFRGESSSNIERDYSSRLENRKDNKIMMIQGEKETQRSEAKGVSHRKLNSQMASTGSFVSASSSQAHEFDSRINRDEIHLLKNDALEKSSALHQNQTTIGMRTNVIDPMTKYKEEKHVEESGRRSSSTSRFKGPSDEMWEMRSATSAEMFNTAHESEENSSSAGTETARRNPKSLWTFVADIIKLGWTRSDGSSKKSGKRSSSSESLNSANSWLSGEEQDEEDEEMDKNRYNDKGKEPLLIEKPSVKTADRSIAETKPKEELVITEPPEIAAISGKEAELKRRKLQRTDQVVKERFDQWEEAYRIEREQRKTDEFFMREALAEAQKAADMWEVPVGAVLVRNGEIFARGCNLVEELRDSTAHAEMVCIREASNFLQSWRLSETTLYVTLEPCAMCAGAILQARIDTVVWGAPNKLVGADGSWVRLFPGDGENNDFDRLSNNTAGPVHPFHPKITTRRGVLATECSEVMQQFFQLRRKKDKKSEKKLEQEPAPPPPHQSYLPTHPVKFFTKVHGIFSMMFCL
ncbi:tRNA(adenine(34)) deaminase, chloroplastic-like [Ananas comosus]|uniref:tRNA(adenine(34)) deaminase n=1 Tax=Ananas comosus TaxID=4615 RepID=A0A6P5FXG3_ANACO|nr:tRNA(adenine(34)) deaminase, chloroplastic-like [Ananas comosus]